MNDLNVFFAGTFIGLLMIAVVCTIIEYILWYINRK